MVANLFSKKWESQKCFQLQNRIQLTNNGKKKLSTKDNIDTHKISKRYLKTEVLVFRSRKSCNKTRFYLSINLVSDSVVERKCDEFISIIRRTAKLGKFV